MQKSKIQIGKKHHDIRISGKKGFYIQIIKKIFTELDYVYLIGKIIKIKILKQKTPIFAICDLNNICNLKCVHCYWWLNRDGEKPELLNSDWKKIIDSKFKKNHILQVNLVGGEPLLRPDIIEVFNEEMPGKFTIVTNGTHKLIDYDGLVAYWISIDGIKETHDKIRGKTFDVIEKNVKEYVKETGHKIWVSMTINTLNCKEIIQVAEYWKNIAESINFQFHTPFMENDPLWVAYGDLRNKVLDEIISLKIKYPEYVINEKKQIDLLRTPWGGDSDGPKNCPNWAIMTLNHEGISKKPCCLGGVDADDMMPMCDKCGMTNYAALFVRGIHI